MPTITLTLVNILQIVFCVQSIYSIIVLLPHQRNRCLIYLLTASALLMTFNLLEELNITYDYYKITPIFSLLFGPLFYFFVRQLSLNESPKCKMLFIHMVPALTFLLLTHYVQFVLAVGTLSQIIYFSLSLKLLNTYRKGCFNTCSDALSLRLDWLRNVLVVMIVITIIDLIRLNLQPFLGFPIANYWYFLMQLAFYFLTSYLVVQAIWQPKRFTGLQHYIEQQQIDTINKADAEIIFSEIEQLIVAGKLHQQPRLSLQDLVLQTSLTSKDISWAINMGAQLNFCEYINSHRVEDVKIKLADTHNLNLLQIAFETGFNSKSSFNKSFKKHTGLTPTQYIKSIKS